LHQKQVARPQGGRLPRCGQWLGWSRNKVAVRERAAGSPPLKRNASEVPGASSQHKLPVWSVVGARTSACSSGAHWLVTLGL